MEAPPFAEKTERMGNSQQQLMTDFVLMKETFETLTTEYKQIKEELTEIITKNTKLLKKITEYIRSQREEVNR